MAAMTVLADGRILAVAGLFGLIEFLADKIPWVDSAWDSVHTFVRPVAAMAMAATALGGGIDPVWRALITIRSGGVALTTHSAKAATRFAMNHRPEPYSNWMLSAAEDLAAPLALWFISAHPGIFLGFLAVFLGGFAYVAPGLMRQIRVEVSALWTLMNRWAGMGPAVGAALPKAASVDAQARAAWNVLHPYVDSIPQDFANKSVVSVGARSVATKSSIGLNRSIGYLCFRDKKLTFLTRRWFRSMGHSIPYTEIKAINHKPGFFMDQVVVEDTRGQVIVFDLFRSAPNRLTAMVPVGADDAASVTGSPAASG